MNKFSFALALGAGLAIGLAAPSVRADAIQSFVPTTMSAGDFNSNFTPTTGVLTNTYSLDNTTSPTGVVESQVFQGSGQYAGFTAYAYQFGVNNVTDGNNQPTFVNDAAMNFNAPPTPASIKGANASVFDVTDGQVGQINVPQSTGATVQAPSFVSYLQGSATGSLQFSWLNPVNGTGPLPAGGNSGTIIVLTQDKQVTTPFVHILNPNPSAAGVQAPMAYAPATMQSPAGNETPEPATIIGWTSVIGALALVRRVRRNRQAV